MSTTHEIALINNVAVRLGELKFPRDLGELEVIVKERILPVIRNPDDPKTLAVADEFQRQLELRQERLVSSRLRILAEERRTGVFDRLRTYRPRPEDDVGAIFEHCRLDLALADMMEAAAKQFDRLNASMLDCEIGN